MNLEPLLLDRKSKSIMNNEYNNSAPTGKLLELLMSPGTKNQDQEILISLQEIQMNQVDAVFCRIAYCPQCGEIYHDRNMPVNIPFCLHCICQHCLRQQLMGQVVNLSSTQGEVINNAKSHTFMVSCVQQENQFTQFKISQDFNECQKVGNYESLQEVEMEFEFNYDVLALAYKHRPKLAQKAHQVYDLPLEDKQLIDVILVNKKAIDQERMNQDIKALQLINYFFLQQKSQQKVLQQMREEVLCFKCYGNFDEQYKQPLILDGCTHKLCRTCYNQFYQRAVETNRPGSSQVQLNFYCSIILELPNEKDFRVVFCIFCGKDRQYKEVSETMQKWIILQSKKKKIVMKRELEAIEQAQQPAVQQIEQELQKQSTLQKRVVFRNDPRTSPKSKMVAYDSAHDTKRQNTGMVKPKDLDAHEDTKSNGSNFVQRIANGQTLMMNRRHKSIMPADQREVVCNMCSEMFNKFNRPILITKCPCSQVHQMCEECFKNTVLRQSAKDRTLFKLKCLNTGQKTVLKSYNIASKQQLFDYYMNPRNRSQFKINQELNYFECVFCVNSPHNFQVY